MESPEEPNQVNSDDGFLAPAPKTGRKKKITLGHGFSQFDWIRTMQQLNLAERHGGFRRYSLAEVKQHRSVGDAWIVIRGRVYDITPYLPFHPAGVDEIMRGAGKDATRLFESIHPWVNVESLLERCCIGIVEG
eukprot:TRINITY_DN20004_c0_g1_i3.p1 TRINITY_DN20004_c0_g1~~TRINITY_DN20004_c0_g1_i3.p1  ORF type:complete len:154 (+),score=21.17 TRINITY_DN20004_c0_g1_i3:62-463(+)